MDYTDYCNGSGDYMVKTVEIEGETYILNPGHQVEALHMTHHIGAFISQAITSHPYIVAHPDLEKMAMDAEIKLAELYQAIGAKDE